MKSTKSSSGNSVQCDGFIFKSKPVVWSSHMTAAIQFDHICLLVRVRHRYVFVLQRSPDDLMI